MAISLGRTGENAQSGGGYIWLLLGGHLVKGVAGPAAAVWRMLATAGHEAVNYAGQSFHSGPATAAARPKVGECGLPLVYQNT